MARGSNNASAFHSIIRGEGWGRQAKRDSQRLYSLGRLREYAKKYNSTGIEDLMTLLSCLNIDIYHSYPCAPCFSVFMAKNRHKTARLSVI